MKSDPKPKKSKPTRADSDIAWQIDLIHTHTAKGTKYLTPCLANVVVLLCHHPAWRGVLAYDEFSEAIITTRTPPWHEADAPAETKPGPWRDEDSARANTWLTRQWKLIVIRG